LGQDRESNGKGYAMSSGFERKPSEFVKKYQNGFLGDLAWAYDGYDNKFEMVAERIKNSKFADADDEDPGAFRGYSYLGPLLSQLWPIKMADRDKYEGIVERIFALSCINSLVRKLNETRKAPVSMEEKLALAGKFKALQDFHKDITFLESWKRMRFVKNM
jgi:hypothetical protein